MNGSDHKRRRGRTANSGKTGIKNTPVKIKIKEASGTIKTGWKMHDGAVVVSGSLIVETAVEDFEKVIAGRLENAARIIKESGGTIGHIKASASVATVEMISVTDEDAMIKQLPERNIRINLTAIVFSIEPETAEEIIKAALGEASSSLKGENSVQT